MKFYHRTSAASARKILSAGFKDGFGAMKGVWISNRPLDPNEGTKTSEALLLINISAHKIAKFEVRERGKPYREWCVPAAALNAGTVELLEVEEPRSIRIARIRAGTEKLDVALHEAGHAVMHVFLGLDNCDDVHINPGPGTLGAFASRKMAFYWTDEPGQSGRMARMECRKYLLVAWAGPEAALREPGLHGTDKALAQKVAKTTAPRRQKKLIGCYQLRARGIITRRLATAIQEFALLLLDQKRIEGRKAESIICGLLGLEVGHAWPQARLDRRKSAARSRAAARF